MIRGWLRELRRRLTQRRYYGLNGLDRKLEHYVDYDHGYFVELGANDGVTQSNSLYFERYRGWRGLLVEPVPHNFIACRRNRATVNAIFCAACVAFDFRDEFVRFAYSNLMSVSLNGESDIANPRQHARKGEQFLGAGETVLEFGAVARTLSSLLEEASAPRAIDFLSLDVEGAELDVLKGVDFMKYRFKYMLVECRNLPRLEAFLAPLGYALVDRLSEQDFLFAPRALETGRRDD